MFWHYLKVSLSLCRSSARLNVIFHLVDIHRQTTDSSYICRAYGYDEEYTKLNVCGAGGLWNENKDRSPYHTAYKFANVWATADWGINIFERRLCEQFPHEVLQNSVANLCESA